MRIFVTGGTGAIGGYAVPALVRAGHSVSGLARSDAKADELRRHGATPVDVSIFDRDGLASAFAGHDAVINLATALPPTRGAIRRSAWAPCERLRTEGSAAVVDAAVTSEVGHLVQESVAMIYAPGGEAWLDEQAPVDHYPMARGNHAAESSARRLAETGRTATVLRFGLFYGPGSVQSEEILAMARRHVGFMPGKASAYLSSIHLADAAEAVLACLDAPGGLYNVVDDEPLTKAGYAQACADAVDARLWLRVPGRLGLLLGDRLTSLTRSLRVSNAQLRSITPWRPRYPSAREGYRSMAAG
jgi:nucleoside-diphosphate-sugar epimerase